MIPSDERSRTVMLASRILDRINADPDDDLAMLSRQFLRSIETHDRLAERVKELEAKLTTILQAHHQSQCGQADGRWWYRYSLAMHEAEKLMGWPTNKPEEPTSEQEKGFADLFVQVEKEKAEQLALTQRLAGMEAALSKINGYEGCTFRVANEPDEDDLFSIYMTCGNTSCGSIAEFYSKESAIAYVEVLKARQALEGK